MQFVLQRKSGVAAVAYHDGRRLRHFVVGIREGEDANVLLSFQIFVIQPQAVDDLVI